MYILSRFLASNSTTTPYALTPGASNGTLDILEALFAGFSVLIGILALAIGVFQLMKHRQRSRSVLDTGIFELEAGLPRVRKHTLKQHRISNLCAALARGVTQDT